MRRSDMIRECEAAGLEPQAVLALYAELRSTEAAEFAERKRVRAEVASRFGKRYGDNLGRVKLACGIDGAGDYATIKAFDEVAADVSRAFPWLAASGDASEGLRDFLGESDSMPTAAETWARALAEAKRRGMRAKAPAITASPDDLLSPPQFASLADITQQWALKKMKAWHAAREGRTVEIAGRLFVLRSTAEAYQRSNEGRPRRQPGEEFTRF